MVSKAAKTQIALADHTKFGGQRFAFVGPLTDIASRARFVYIADSLPDFIRDRYKAAQDDAECINIGTLVNSHFDHASKAPR